MSCQGVSSTRPLQVSLTDFVFLSCNRAPFANAANPFAKEANPSKITPSESDLPAYAGERLGHSARARTLWSRLDLRPETLEEVTRL